MGTNGTAEELAREIAAQMLIPAGEPLTDERAAEFKERLQEALASGDRTRFLPPAPLLAPETARALLRECVTVVKPGEVLVIRVPDTWTHQQVCEYQRYADDARTVGRVPFRALVVVGDELAVVQPETDEAFAARVRAVVHGDMKKASRLHGGDARTSLPG